MKTIFTNEISYNDRNRIFNTEQSNNVCKGINYFVEHQNDNDGKNHQITVFCDYDTDGVCSAKVAYESLILAGMQPDNVHVMPDVRGQGFGLNMSYIDKIVENYPKTGLIITTDNGSGFNPTDVNLQALPYIIVTDHHPQSEEEYQNFQTLNKFLINPNQYNSKYPFKGFSGTGTVYKLFQKYFYEKVIANQTPENLKAARKFGNLITYVALSIISDQMPTTDENTSMFFEGLKRINNTNCDDQFWINMKNEFINNYTKEFNDVTFGWTIAPMMNADSRINLDPYTALFTLIPDKRAEFIKMAPRLEDFTNYSQTELVSDNTTKQAVNKMLETNEIRKDIIHELTEKTFYNTKYMICIGEDLLSDDLKQRYFDLTHRNDHIYLSSVAGIVAGNILNKTGYPAIVVAFEEFIDNEYRYLGSARAPEGFNLMDLNVFPELKLHGHKQAAGVGVDLDDENKLINLMAKTHNLIEKSFTPKIKAKMPTIPIDNLDVYAIKQINHEAEINPNYTKPLYEFNDWVSDVNYNFKILDSRKANGQRHLKITKKGANYEIMIWNINDNPDLTRSLEALDIPFHLRLFSTPRINNFMNTETPQISVTANDIDVTCGNIYDESYESQYYEMMRQTQDYGGEKYTDLSDNNSQPTAPFDDLF